MRLTKKQLTEAAALWNEGVRAWEIGAKFGLSPDAVRQLVKRHRDLFPQRHLGKGKVARRLQCILDAQSSTALRALATRWECPEAEAVRRALIMAERGGK